MGKKIRTEKQPDIDLSNRISRLLSCKQETVERALVELSKDIYLLERIEEKVAPVDEFFVKTWGNCLDLGFYRCSIYAMTRILKPSVVIETGILHGLTSAYILAALQKNQFGRLISIDLPSTPETGPSNNDGYDDVLPIGQSPGWVVPDYLRPFWETYLGNSLEILPKVLQETTEIDFFIHDSDHSYEVMKFECDLASSSLMTEQY